MLLMIEAVVIVVVRGLSVRRMSAAVVVVADERVVGLMEGGRSGGSV